MKKGAKKKILAGIVIALVLTIGVIVPQWGGGGIDPPGGTIQLIK